MVFSFSTYLCICHERSAEEEEGEEESKEYKIRQIRTRIRNTCNSRQNQSCEVATRTINTCSVLLRRAKQIEFVYTFGAKGHVARDHSRTCASHFQPKVASDLVSPTPELLLPNRLLPRKRIRCECAPPSAIIVVGLAWHHCYLIFWYQSASDNSFSAELFSIYFNSRVVCRFNSFAMVRRLVWLSFSGVWCEWCQTPNKCFNCAQL